VSDRIFELLVVILVALMLSSVAYLYIDRANQDKAYKEKCERCLIEGKR